MLGATVSVSIMAWSRAIHRLACVVKHCSGRIVFIAEPIFKATRVSSIFHDKKR